MAIYQGVFYEDKTDDGVYDPLWWVPKEEKDSGDKEQLPGDGDTTDVPPPVDPGGGGGGGYGSGGSGGSAVPAGLSEYIQEYRIRFFADGKPPADLLKRAKANNWTLAYFDMQVRMHDPKYVTSLEARTLLPSLNRTMKVLFPGLADKARQAQLMKSKFYRQTALWYLKNGIGLTTGGEELLFARITGTQRWRQANPYWKDYAKNRNVGVAAEANPLLYKEHLANLRSAYQQVGLEGVPDDYLRTFFRSRYASESGFQDLMTNLKGYSQTGGSMGWWQGKAMDKGQVKTATLVAGKKGLDLRQRMAMAFGAQSSFTGSDERGFDAQLSKRGQVINPTL